MLITGCCGACEPSWIYREHAGDCRLSHRDPPCEHERQADTSEQLSCWGGNAFRAASRQDFGHKLQSDHERRSPTPFRQPCTQAATSADRCSMQAATGSWYAPHLVTMWSAAHLKKEGIASTFVCRGLLAPLPLFPLGFFFMTCRVRLRTTHVVPMSFSAARRGQQSVVLRLAMGQGSPEVQGCMLQQAVCTVRPPKMTLQACRKGLLLTRAWRAIAESPSKVQPDLGNLDTEGAPAGNHLWCTSQHFFKWCFLCSTVMIQPGFGAQRWCCGRSQCFSVPAWGRQIQRKQGGGAHPADEGLLPLDVSTYPCTATPCFHGRHLQIESFPWTPPPALAHPHHSSTAGICRAGTTLPGPAWAVAHLDGGVLALLPLDLHALGPLQHWVLLVHHVVRLHQLPVAEVGVLAEGEDEAEALQAGARALQPGAGLLPAGRRC